MRGPKLVGICGSAGVGKNTFAEEFHYFGFKEYSFAGPVKKACEAAFGIGPDYFTNRQLKEEEHPFWNLSPREIAQKVGTELFRENFGPDFWIRRLQLQLILDFTSSQEVVAVVTDVRFQNEAQWILDSGGVLVHLTRPGYEGNVGIPGHASEAGIDFSTLNYSPSEQQRVFVVVNDATKADLTLKANQFVVKYLARQVAVAV